MNIFKSTKSPQTHFLRHPFQEGTENMSIICQKNELNQKKRWRGTRNAGEDTLLPPWKAAGPQITAGGNVFAWVGNGTFSGGCECIKGTYTTLAKNCTWSAVILRDEYKLLFKWNWFCLLLSHSLSSPLLLYPIFPVISRCYWAISSATSQATQKPQALESHISGFKFLFTTTSQLSDLWQNYSPYLSTSSYFTDGENELQKG
jgi:hypothetical protein